MNLLKDLIIAAIKRWLRCLWWSMPWKISHPDWEEDDHLMTTITPIGMRWCSPKRIVACSCGEIFHNSLTKEPTADETSTPQDRQ